MLGTPRLMLSDGQEGFTAMHWAGVMVNGGSWRVNQGESIVVNDES